MDLKLALERWLKFWSLRGWPKRSGRRLSVYSNRKLLVIPELFLLCKALFSGCTVRPTGPLVYVIIEYKEEKKYGDDCAGYWAREGPSCRTGGSIITTWERKLSEEEGEISKLHNCTWIVVWFLPLPTTSSTKWYRVHSSWQAVLYIGETQPVQHSTVEYLSPYLTTLIDLTILARLAISLAPHKIRRLAKTQ